MGNPLEDGNLSAIDDMSDEQLLEAMMGKPKPKPQKKWWVVLIQFTLLLAFGLGLSLWWSFVTMVNWNWFLVPLGVMQVGFWHVMGIGTVVSLFLANSLYHDISKGGKNGSIRFYAILAVYPAVALLFGWIFQMLM